MEGHDAEWQADRGPDRHRRRQEGALQTRRKPQSNENIMRRTPVEAALGGDPSQTTQSQSSRCSPRRRITRWRLSGTCAYMTLAVPLTICLLLGLQITYGGERNRYIVEGAAVVDSADQFYELGSFGASGHAHDSAGNGPGSASVFCFANGRGVHVDASATGYHITEPPDIREVPARVSGSAGGTTILTLAPIPWDTLGTSDLWIPVEIGITSDVNITPYDPRGPGAFSCFIQQSSIFTASGTLSEARTFTGSVRVVKPHDPTVPIDLQVYMSISVFKGKEGYAKVRGAYCVGTRPGDWPQDRSFIGGLPEGVALVPELTGPSMDTEIFQCSLIGEHNRAYVIQGAGDLLDWTDLTEVTVDGMDAPVSIDLSQTSARFFRAQLKP